MATESAELSFTVYGWDTAHPDLPRLIGRFSSELDAETIIRQRLVKARSGYTYFLVDWKMNLQVFKKPTLEEKK